MRDRAILALTFAFLSCMIKSSAPDDNAPRATRHCRNSKTLQNKLHIRRIGTLALN